MLIDVVRPESWEELNDEVRHILNLGPKLKTRVFKGLGQAVFEIAQGTAQFMAHKKSIGVLHGQTPVFESLLPYYYKETYDVQALEHTELKDIKAWVEGLNKDTSFVLYSEDHPVTGELYSFVEELDKLLNEKRICSFRVSHAHHFFHSEDIRPYTARICSFSGELAVAILGERFRSPALMAPNLNWDKEFYLTEFADSKKDRHQEHLQVEKYEAEVAPAVQVYFKAGQTRLFDRAVLVFQDASAEAIAQSLQKKLGWTDEETWQKLATTNMCHWSGIKMFKHWWLPQPSDTTLRGLLVVRADALSIKDFAKLTISSYEEIKQLQSWSL